MMYIVIRRYGRASVDLRRIVDRKTSSRSDGTMIEGLELIESLKGQEILDVDVGDEYIHFHLGNGYLLTIYNGIDDLVVDYGKA